MKRLLFLAAILLSQLSYAQEKSEIFIEKGRWGLGGHFSFSSLNSKTSYYEFATDSDAINLEVSPNLTYSFSDNWLVGVGLRYTYTNLDNEEGAVHGIGIAPTIQRYFPILDKLAFNLKGSIEYFYKKIPYSGGEDATYKRYSANIRPGFSYLIHKRFAFEVNTGLLRYAKIKEEGEGRTEFDRFRVDFGLSNFQLGGIFFF